MNKPQTSIQYGFMGLICHTWKPGKQMINGQSTQQNVGNNVQFTNPLQFMYTRCIFLTRSKIITKLPQNDASNIKMQRSLEHNQPIKFCYSVTFTTNVKCTRLNNKISLKLLPDKAIIHARHRLSSGLSKIPTHCTYKYRLYASVVIDNSISQNFDKCSCTLMKKFAQ